MLASTIALLGLSLTHGAHSSAVETRSERTKWQPAVGASWQIILSHALDLSSLKSLSPDVDIYDLDLYDNDAEVFSELQKAGKKVVC